MDDAKDQAHEERTVTFFADFNKCLYTGSGLETGLEISRQALRTGAANAVVIFDDATGAMTELNPRESSSEFLSRIGNIFLRRSPGTSVKEPARSGPGRPRLGVVSREVSLLPRHWEWLSSQPGKASATLRKLVEEAMRQKTPQVKAVQARDAVYRVMSQLAGAEADYEEVSRALFARRYDELSDMIEGWQPDVRDYLRRLVKIARLYSMQPVSNSPLPLL